MPRNALHAALPIEDLLLRCKKRHARARFRNSLLAVWISDPQPILKVLRLRWATAVSMVQSADLLSLVRFSPSIRYRGTANSSVFVYLIRLHPHYFIFSPL